MEPCHNCDGRGTIQTWRGNYKKAFTDSNGKTWYTQQLQRVRCPSCSVQKQQPRGKAAA